MKLEKDLERSLITDIPIIHVSTNTLRASQVALVVKNPSANAGDIRDVGSTPGLGRFPREGNGTPLQYSCLGNLMDRGALGL